MNWEQVCLRKNNEIRENDTVGLYIWQPVAEVNRKQTTHKKHCVNKNLLLAGGQVQILRQKENAKYSYSNQNIQTLYVCSQYMETNVFQIPYVVKIQRVQIKVDKSNSTARPHNQACHQSRICRPTFVGTVPIFNLMSCVSTCLSKNSIDVFTFKLTFNYLIFASKSYIGISGANGWKS